MRPENFARLTSLLHHRSGLSLGPDKMYLVEARLGPIMSQRSLTDLDGLILSVCNEPESALAADVIEAMTTNETLFFRDGHPFVDLAEKVLPKIIAARPPGAKLRIWSAASSHGQEAYSIAIVLHELAALLGKRQVEIIGTDIARFAVARAKNGVYTDFEIQRGLSVARRNAHFRSVAGHWHANTNLRGAAEFRQLNLLHDLRGLGRFDIVFCRNVLIYFDRPTKERVLRSISQLMAPDGVLYVGGSETLLGFDIGLRKLPDCGAYGVVADRAAPSAQAALLKAAR